MYKWNNSEANQKPLPTSNKKQDKDSHDEENVMAQ